MNKNKRNKKTKLPGILLFSLLKKPKSNADIIHRNYAIYFWRQCRTVKDRLSVIKAIVLSPYYVIEDISKGIGKFGLKVHRHVGKNILSQILEQLYLQIHYSIDSESYYLQEFYHKGGLKRAKNFVNKGALKFGVYRLLTSYAKYNNNLNTYSLGKKSAFIEFCNNNQIPTVPIIKEFLSDGTVKDYLNIGEGLPNYDIFCKPNVDNEGKGAEAWYWDKEKELFRNCHGRYITSQKLVQRLMKQSVKHNSGSILVQPLILPHESLAYFRKNATPTIRIISHIDTEGEVRLDIGMFRFSLSPDAVVDNASAGGMIAPINMSCGTLGPAVHSDPYHLERWDKLLGKKEVNGLEIPYWHDTLNTVKKAHKLLPSKILVGWDILITNDGPVVLEANSQPGLCFIQRAHSFVLGDIPLGKSIAQHSSKAIDALYNGRLESKDSTLKLYDGSAVKRFFSWLFLKNNRTVTVRVYGKVHAPSYKNWAAKKAKTYKVTGWIKNAADNSIEAVFSGRTIDIEDMVKTCWLGPPGTAIEKVDVDFITPKKRFDSFKVIE